MKITVEVNIDFDKEEPEFCGNDCRFLQLADEYEWLGDDHCSLFHKDLSYKNDFALRCRQCILAVKNKQSIKGKNA
jgi:hypothetical protein